jgi:hypothetical protein
MVLLQVMIQGAARPMHHPFPEHVPNRVRVGVMAIRGDPVGRHPDHRPGRAEKGFGRRQVTCVVEPHID